MTRNTAQTGSSHSAGTPRPLGGRPSFRKGGEAFIWLTGGALAFSLLLVSGLLVLVLVNGLGFFWPSDLYALTLDDGTRLLGRIEAKERIPTPGSTTAAPPKFRLKVKQGNRDLYGADFVWLDEARVVLRERPTDAIAVERREWGDFYGLPIAVRDGEKTVAEGTAAAWKALVERLPEAESKNAQALALEKGEIGSLNTRKEKLRLKRKRLENQGVTTGAAVEALDREAAALQASYEARLLELNRVRDSVKTRVVLRDASAPVPREKELSLSQIVRVYRPNDMGLFAKCRHYVGKIWEFVSADPRESNTEGGVFPAIFGTVMMVMIMSLVVTPLGVLAAFYLREYAKQGPFVSAVRIAVNNLAGVPSIVFGVFGVGFFVYLVGGSIDKAFFAEALPTPTFGTGGILWASLTLALLTVPVVIVAAEEGLAAIPRGTREASLALGATKFETMWRVVLPAVMPSVLTGLILAMARAAGEVAPLMITGVVKLAPALPIDGTAPFLHFDRKFMHLGFHIYDVGFQSPNVDAARPMVYMTTLLLLLVVVALNLTAILTRNKLKKRLRTSGL